MIKAAASVVVTLAAMNLLYYTEKILQGIHKGANTWNDR